VAILLSGFGTPPLDGVKHHGFGGGFIDLFDDESTARLWQQHEPFLRAEAARYGIQPEFEADNGTLLFYGELVTHELRLDEATRKNEMLPGGKAD
jgi:hypothetical protein